jgi:hypothetical protein
VALDADVNWYKRVRPRAFDRAPPLQPQVMDVGPASVIPARNIPEDGSSRYSEVQGAQGPSFLHQPQSVVSASVVTTSQLREVRKPNKRGRPRTRGPNSAATTASVSAGAKTTSWGRRRRCPNVWSALTTNGRRRFVWRSTTGSAAKEETKRRPL